MELQMFASFKINLLPCGFPSCHSFGVSEVCIKFYSFNYCIHVCFFQDQVENAVRILEVPKNLTELREILST